MSQAEVERLKRKLAREDNARVQAESLLERKSLELYRANQELQALNASLEDTVAQKTQQLQESEFRFRSLVESASDIIYRANSVGICTYVNPVATKVLGFQVGELLGKHFSELVRPDKAVEVASFYRDQIKSGKSQSYYEFPVIGKSGREVWVGQNLQYIFGENGKLKEVMAIVRDITAVKESEDRLRRSEEKYRGIIENMELGLLEVGNNGLILKAYSWFCDMVGYREDELVGQDPLKIFLHPNDHQLMEEQTANRSRGQAGVYETRLKRKDGVYLWVLISGAPIYDELGEVQGTIGIHLDITQRKELEQKLHDARITAEEAQRSEKQFLAQMSHEIRTPLNSIIGMTYLLYDTYPDKEQLEYMDAVKNAANMLQGLISDVLDIAKIESGEFELKRQEFNLSESLNSIITTFSYRAEEKGISLGLTDNSNLKNTVVGDTVVLNQILVNLIGNAIKFTESGQIHLTVNQVFQKEEGLQLVFELTDTGLGMSNSQKSLIFKRFKQATSDIHVKYGGSGLGLFITRKLVEMCGGEIEVESSTGVGSTFRFTLYFQDSGRLAQPGLGRASKVSAEGLFQSTKVLVVEDNPMNQKYIRRLLEKWEVSFQIVDLGRKALKLLETKPFDLILMDIQMPEMNGYEVTRAIRAREAKTNASVPIIALTASALLSEKRKATEAGMNGYLTKPFTPDQLRGEMSKHVKGKKHQQPEETVETEFEQVMGVLHAAFDKKHLRLFYEGDTEYLMDMFATFLEVCPASMQEFAQATSTKDWGKARSIAHKIKPIYEMVGFAPTGHLAEKIEALSDSEMAQKESAKLWQDLAQQSEAIYPHINEALLHIEEVTTSKSSYKQSN